jgi:uncharacterized membrane protein (DUF485 family)
MDNLRLLQNDNNHAAVGERRHRRFGLWLFALYLLVYAGFIGIATFNHSAFTSRAFFGVNVAIMYGFGLIGLAFALALTFLVAGDNSSAPRQERRG